MNRVTKFQDGNFYVEEIKIQQDKNGYTGEAVTRLAKFENLYEDLIAKQIEISKELEILRVEGKMRTVKFKQLLANKLTNNNIIQLLQFYGIDEIL